MINKKPIRLRKPEEEDLDLALEWLKSGESFLFAGDMLPASANLREMILDQINAPFNYDSNIYLVIETKEGISAGMIIFHSINWKDRNTFMEVFLTDKKDNNIFSIFRAASDFAFNEINLHKIWVNFLEDKSSIINIAEKVGAKKEQTLKKHFYFKKKFYDVYVYGLLRDECG